MLVNIAPSQYFISATTLSKKLTHIFGNLVSVTSLGKAAGGKYLQRCKCEHLTESQSLDAGLCLRPIKKKLTQGMSKSRKITHATTK